MTIHQVESKSLVMSSHTTKTALRLVLGLCALAAVVATSSPSQAQIKQPNSHPHYEWDVEPHLVFRYNREYWGSDGWGPGLRATYIFSDNGPISSINNTMGIGFGLDWARFDSNCNNWGRGWDNNNWGNCSGNEYMVPVVVQWNFYFTKMLSVFGEPGLMINRRSWKYDVPCPAGRCETTESHTDVDPVFFAGASLHFNDKIALTGRLLWSYASIGLSITF